MTTIDSVGTPALLLDLDSVERSRAGMAERFAQTRVKLEEQCNARSLIQHHGRSR